MFELTVKNGDYGYRDGVYANCDYIYKTKDVVEALRQFFEYMQGEDYEDGEKVTLTFRSSKSKKGKKKGDK